MSLNTFAYRHRLVAKRTIAALAKVLPATAGRKLRALAERAAFNMTPQYQGETLPPIFGYWSSRFLAPDAHRLGIDSPEAFYFSRILQHASNGGMPLRVLSVGAGACDMEVGLAEQLKAAGVHVHITCLDFNPALMRRAATTAQARQVSALMAFEARDCNLPFRLPPQDVIIVNQFFHHVTELETFCRSLRESLAPAGMLLSSDIIGRNGHLLWPDVETEVQQIWAELPAAKRHDRHFNAMQTRYRPINHAAYSNEGVRAQDIVGCLLVEFDFELFFSFGAAIVPFIERRIGFNFDPQQADDQALIDRIHALDAAALSRGRYPAANMIAAMRHKGGVTQSPIHEPITAEQHVALTEQQRAKTLPVRGWRSSASE
ncbi:MAG: class I SAM-dependent methyltransferase [Lysobacterales bacterium]